MKAKKLRIVKEEKNINITDITLLTKEEAEIVPESLVRANSAWWLRSPGIHEFRVLLVDSGHGSINTVGLPAAAENGVRPALKISNLWSSDLSVGDKFELAGREWTVINGDTALCDDIVGKTAFLKNYDEYTDDINDYEQSDIKRWLKSWANKNGIKITPKKNSKRITISLSDGKIYVGNFILPDVTVVAV